MELNKLEKDLLSKIADIESTPIGAYNIRENGKGIARNTTTNIDIITKTDKCSMIRIIQLDADSKLNTVSMMAT